MIQFFFENLPESVNTEYTKWLQEIIFSEGKKLGDINYIFCDDASTLSRDYEEELRRVLAHGILHLCGYKDKTEAEQKEMRGKEDHYLALFIKKFSE